LKICKPNRVTRTYKQKILAAPARVLPLLCPVREADWIEDWDPTVVYSESGVVEPDCVFVTAAEPSDAIWFVTRLDTDASEVEMVKVIPEVSVCKLKIQLVAAAHGTDATVTYSQTSLGPAGDVAVEAFSEEYYTEFMREWETRLNHYLSTGQCLGRGVQFDCSRNGTRETP
jgi:hypothetical protein